MTKIRFKIPEIKKKRILILGIPYLLIGYLADKLFWLYRHNPGDRTGIRLANTIFNYRDAFSNVFPSLHPKDLLFGAFVALMVKLAFMLKEKKNLRRGEEYGSACWGTENDIKPFVDNDPENNIILTATESLTMKSGAGALDRNKNVLVIGGSGSGKTRFFVKPNLMQLHSSYIVTDPKGQILVECGHMLKKAGYDIRVFNTVNFKKSMHYNPFHYIDPEHAEQDILKLVNTLITNTKGEGEKADFWTKAEALLYQAYIGYIWYEAPEDEQNFSTLLDFINASEVREDDETFKNAVDLLFEELEEEKPEHFAVSQYKNYKLAAGKTAKSILISCAARLAPFGIRELREITSYDEMDFESLGEQKSALFIIISDSDATFNFLVAIMYSQLFNRLVTLADDKYGGKLPIHVRVLADEFANIGQIPNFDKLIATLRSREISASIILQSRSQLKSLYKDNADTIIGNCDTMLFLGSKETTTLKEISEMLGKQTIDLSNTSDTRGNSPSYGISYQKTGRELMTVDELAIMDGGKCILQLRGVRPFFSDKYDITRHKRYQELSDFNRKLTFDIECFVRHKAKLKKSDIAEVSDIEISEETLERLLKFPDEHEEGEIGKTEAAYL